MEHATSPRKIVMGCDHGGLELKNNLKVYLTGKGFEVIDVGTHTTDACDYPVIARAACEKLLDLSNGIEFGIIACGTGIGISIAANKVPGIRCALCHDVTTARLSREHNNANILALGGRTTGFETAKDIADTFLSVAFSGAERHARRVAML